MISGESAGGIGAFEHADFFTQTLHWAEVKSVPIGTCIAALDEQASSETETVTLFILKTLQSHKSMKLH